MFEGAPGCADRYVGPVQVAEMDDDAVLLRGHAQRLAVQGLDQALDIRAALGDPGFGTGKFRQVRLVFLAIGQQGLVIVGLSALTVQLRETALQQVLAGPEGNRAHRRIGDQGLQGSLALRGNIFRLRNIRQSGRHEITQRRPSRITGADLAAKGVIDFIFIRFGRIHLPAHQQVPQDILPVVLYKFFQRTSEITAQVTPEFRMVALREGIPSLPDIFPTLIGRFSGVFAHPGVGHDGLVELADQGGEFLAGRFALLPVAAGRHIDILRGGIIEIRGQVLPHRFGADFLQDFQLSLGTVGPFGLVIFGPARRQHVAF